MKKIIQSFLEWRGDKEMVNLGIANKGEIFRANNWCFRDYYILNKAKLKKVK